MVLSYVECPCGISRDVCDYHKPQQAVKNPYICRYPDCANNSVYFAVGNIPTPAYLCREHYNFLLDGFKKYYTLPVDLF